MEHQRQDIYDSEQTETKRSDQVGGRPQQDRNRWDDVFRQSKRSTTIFRLIILAFIVFISLFLVEYLKTGRKEHVDYQAGEASEIVRTRTDSILDFGGDFQNELIIDEIADIEPSSIDASGEMEMNIHWVKQAAVHLVKAEQAYKSEQWKSAIEHYENTLKILPDMKGVDERLGLCYMRLKEYDASADAFARISANSTNSFKVLNNIGVARLANKEFGKAEKNFARVLELKPDYMPALYNMSLLYYRTQMYAEAIDYFERYFSEIDEDLEALQLYTDALVKTERWEDAGRVLERSSKQMPGVAPVYMSLAYVLSKTGEMNKAMENLRRGVNLVDRSKAMAMLAAPEYDALRQRQDFKDLVDRITSE